MLERIAGLGLAISLSVLSFTALLAATASSTIPSSGEHIIISEVAWAGTVANAGDEWIELFNPDDAPTSLSGWLLYDSSGDLRVALTGTIAAQGFYLLERTDDQTIRDVPADQLYTGGLNNGGEILTLQDSNGIAVDTVNGDGGDWPAGSASPEFRSMERVHPDTGDVDDGWTDHDGVTQYSHDANGNSVNGTPGQANTTWPPGAWGLDLVVSKSAPTVVIAGAPLQYHISVTNRGEVAATDVLLTDTLSAGLTYVEDNSGLPLSRPAPGVLVWALGTVPGSSTIQFSLTARVAPATTDSVVNTVAVGTPLTETTRSNNQAVASTALIVNPSVRIVIDAVLYDGYEPGDADEAVQLRNVGTMATSLAEWQLGDGSHVVLLPDEPFIEVEDSIWLAADGAAFQRQFGFAPDAVLSSWPGFANTGDEVVLRKPDGAAADVLVYKEGDVSVQGWQGPALQPYQVAGLFAEEGQILFRRRDQRTGQPVDDTNSAEDWSQWTADVLNGRKVQYPGWSLDRFFSPEAVTTTATITVAIAPDNAYDAVVRHLRAARSTIRLQTLTLENLGIAEALISAAQRGVEVTVLLEGEPAGGIVDQERYICQQLERYGGACWFMIRDDASHVHDRYRFLHAKFAVIDDQYAVIGSENFSPRSLPYDDKQDGTWGRRGVVLITDAPPVAKRLVAIFMDDFDPESHHDLLRWTAAHPVYGAPSPGFTPLTVTGGTTYTVRYLQPQSFTGRYRFTILQSPENSLRDVDGLLGLLNKAGAGDTILVQQLTERPYWGRSTSNHSLDPNPRLESYIAAARRGAKVRLLLDHFLDDDASPTSNSATCRYVNDLAMQEGLNLRCALANPTGLGIHNKMVLVHVGGRGWVHVGSLNGTEQSHKGNREVALQVQSDAAYEYLAGMFKTDWPHLQWMPLLALDYRTSAAYPLISEVMYDPMGPDDVEFIELAKPTPAPIDLSN